MQRLWSYIVEIVTYLIITTVCTFFISGGIAAMFGVVVYLISPAQKFPWADAVSLMEEVSWPISIMVIVIVITATVFRKR